MNNLQKYHLRNTLKIRQKGRFFFFAVIAMSCFFFCQSLQAQEIFTNKQGVAINGYDAVAYFDDGKASAGKADYSTVWRGATWYFASEKHRDTFVQSPEKYAPQYGGFCAFGMCLKKKQYPTDPALAWKIINGKLYLNYDKKTQELFEKNLSAETFIQGDANWSALLQAAKQGTAKGAASSAGRK